MEKEKALLCRDCKVQLGGRHQHGALAKQYPTMQESEYRRKLLQLFREKGLDINAEQLDMLLLLRQKTDQMLLGRESDGQENGE